MEKLQHAVIGAPSSLVLPEDEVNEDRERKMRAVRKIVDIYNITGNTFKRQRARVYQSLTDNNPYVRVAAADVISKRGDKGSFDYLFSALEDEGDPAIKQKIARSIDNLEARLSNKPLIEEDDTSLMDAIRIISYTK